MTTSADATTHYDLAAPRPFTGAALDRVDSERKDPEAVAKLLGDPAAQAVFANADGVLVDGEGDGLLLRGGLNGDPLPEPILLGLDPDGRPMLAAELNGLAPEHRERLLGEGSLISLREAGATLPHAEAGLAAYLTAMLNWHRTHRFCANCGAPTDVAEAGASRHCPNCGVNHFPRTDPVVIMTVSHEDRLLLGRRESWPSGRMSVLAGFIAPGESAEEAVVREVREESGIEAADPVYLSSQPWPFPASLMLGFDARSPGGDPRARDGELAEVGWVPLADVRAAARGEHPTLRLPPPVSIARFLIERWLRDRV